LQLTVLIEENVTTFLLDAKRVRQILFNVLSNAIGFSSEEQAIELTVRETQSSLIIAVKDNGRGIPPEIIDKVFDRFQTYTVSSRHRGAGLGLSIVKTLMQLHDGEVAIESELGGGTVVTCTFPKIKTF
jgi:signal transduction histidine kinase